MWGDRSLAAPKQRLVRSQTWTGMMEKYLKVADSGIEKGEATLHPAMFHSARVRVVLRCCDAIDRVVQTALTFLVISSLVSEGRMPSNQTEFLFFWSLSLWVPVQIRFYQPIFVERNVQNEIKLLCQWLKFWLLLPEGWCWRTPSTSVLSWDSFSKTVMRGAFSVTLFRRTILPLSIGGETQCVHVYPCMSIAQLCAVFFVPPGLAPSS